MIWDISFNERYLQMYFLLQLLLSEDIVFSDLDPNVKIKKMLLIH
jgi:hypothetical protein